MIKKTALILLFILSIISIIVLINFKSTLYVHHNHPFDYEYNLIVEVDNQIIVSDDFNYNPYKSVVVEHPISVKKSKIVIKVNKETVIDTTMYLLPHAIFFIDENASGEYNILVENSFRPYYPG